MNTVISTPQPRQPNHPQLDTANPDQWRAVADVLAGAFSDDPVLGWLLPERSVRSVALRRLFSIETRDVALPHHASLVAVHESRIAAAALILPPGHWRTPLGVQARHVGGFARIFGRRLGLALAVLTSLERVHPRYPHYYLPFIGVAQASQGHGLGSALLSDLGRRCDEQGLPAYLEATSPDNARLYRRHGFVTLETIRPFGAPPIERMQRPARR